ncbi:zinc ribbon domain-containing protein [bacterium]|nr:zinc ribbon domain-containing protein [bacterium]
MSYFCVKCGQSLASDSKFCPECGQAVTAGQPRPESTSEGPLYWTAEFPLVTSRFFLRDVSKVLFFTYLVMAVLMVLMTAASGDSPAQALPLLAYLALPVIGLGLMMLLIALVVLGNRAGAIYCMDENGLAMVSRSKAQPLNELSQWLGILSGDGRLWASGVLAEAQEKTYIKWKSVHALREYSSNHIIELSDSFHMAMRVYCPPEIYPEAVRRARSQLARQTVGRQARSRVPVILGWLALTILSVLLGVCWEPKVNDVGFMVVLTGMFVFLCGLLPGRLRKGIGLFGLLCGLCALGHRLYHLLDPQVLRREDDFWPALLASLGCLALVGMAGYQMFRDDVTGQETVLFDEDLDGVAQPAYSRSSQIMKPSSR